MLLKHTTFKSWGGKNQSFTHASILESMHATKVGFRVLWAEDAYQYTYKNEAERDLTDRRGSRNVTTEAETGVMWSQTKECAATRLPLQPSQGVQPC